MNYDRHLYKTLVIFAVASCLVGVGLAFFASGQLAVASLCIALGCLFVIQHLNNRFTIGQINQIQSRLGEFHDFIQEHSDAGFQRIENIAHEIDQRLLLLNLAQVQVDGSLNNVERQSRKLVALQQKLQVDVTDMIRRVKISQKAIVKVEEELRLGTNKLSLDLEQHYQAVRRRVDHRYDALRIHSEKLPGEIVALWHAAKLVLPEHADLPLLGGWAVTAPTLTAMLNEIRRNPERNVVVECGSGVSTIWLAHACRHRGHGHVYALEHDEKFADGTRQYITRNNLEDWATVIDAPLTLYAIDGNEYMWYSLDGLSEVNGIDLLFVDGPPGNTGPMARLPAFPALSSRLSNDAWVVLDDTIRKEERDIATSWCEKPEHGIQLFPLIELPKSLVLVATRKVST